MGLGSLGVLVKEVILSSIMILKGFIGFREFKLS